MEAVLTRRVLVLAIVGLLAVASAAVAFTPGSGPSPIGDKSIGQLNAEALKDSTFAAEVEHFLREHGVDHPQRVLDIQTLDPVERAKVILTQESMQGRTPQAWLDLTSPQALLALRPAAPVEGDLVDAVVRIADAAGSPLTSSEIAQVERDAAALPADVREPFARLATRVADAYEAQVPIAAGIVARAPDAKDPLDLVITDVEREAMLANAFSVVAAANAFRDEFPTVGLASTPGFRDPVGLVVLGSSGNDVHTRGVTVKDPVLSVDPLGDDTYQNGAGAACPDPLSLAHACNLLALALALDLAGNDLYTYTGEPSVVQGAGSIGGVGILIDAAGSDTYFGEMVRTTKNPVFSYVDGGMQGFGQAGVGLLLDASGDDKYTANVRSTAGRSIWLFGQGYGGVGGTGLIADALGNDGYYANGLSSTMSGGNFQGVYTNGASIYAGVGISSDTGLGNDVYHAWDNATRTDYYAQGFGAFGGLGILFEDGGNDDYIAVEISTGSNPIDPLLNCAFGAGSLGGVGIMIELGGDDRYFGDSVTPRTGYTMNEGFGGPGPAYGLFVDVTGDDGHFMQANGQEGSYTFGRGVLIVNLGHALLGSGGNMGGTYLDAGGLDQYTGAAPSADGSSTSGGGRTCAGGACAWVGGADINTPIDFLR